MKMDTEKGDAREVVRQLAPRIREGAAERDRRRIYPDEEMELVKKSGLLGLMVPKAYGGLGASIETLVDVMAVLAEADPNVAQSIQSHTAGVEALKYGGTEEVKAKYLRAAAEGWLITNAYVDVSGKNVLEVRVTVRPDGENYRLNGSKFYCTGSRFADAFYVAAVVDGTAEGRLAYCKADAPGVEIHDDWDGMGQRTTASGTVEFRDVLIRGDSCIPGEPFNRPNYIGANSNIMFAAYYVGIARAAMNDAVEYLRSEARPWFQSNVDRAVDDPYVVHHVGGWKVAIDCAELLLGQASRAVEAARESGDVKDRDLASVTVGEAKIASTEAVLKIANELFQVCGTRSARAKWNFDRHWRNARILTLHDPVDYKYKIVGEYVLSGTSPPVSAWT